MRKRSAVSFFKWRVLMKRFYTIILFLFLININLYADAPRVVRVGAFNFYPGIFRDSDGQIKGFYVDSLQEIAQKENIRFEYVWGTWSEGLKRIKSGEVDILTSVAYTPERAMYMDYCKTPLITVWSELYVAVKSDIDNITALEGKKVAVMRDDFNASCFMELIKKFRISVKYVEVNSFDEVFDAVSSKKADAGVVNCTFGVAKQKKYSIRSTGVVFNPFDIYFASAKNKNNDILQLLDSYLHKWKHQKDSVYNLSRQKWSHGSTGAIRYIPRWIMLSTSALVIMVIIFFSFTIILRLKVKSATKSIMKRKYLLKQSESKLRSYIDCSPDGIFVFDAEGRYIEVNPAAVTITGFTESELLCMTYRDLKPRQSADSEKKYFSILNETGRISSEIEFVNKYGEKRWCSVESVLLSENLYLGFARDITVKKHSEQKIQNLLHEKEILLKEVHHRIKNNMNTIKGLLTLQMHSIDDPRYVSPLADAESRVQSMIILYDKLYCSENYRELSVKDYLLKLTNEIIYNFPNRDIVSFETEIEDFILNVKVLAPLGIIVNELLTNIMKHAFTGKNSGIIKIIASLKNNRVTLVVSDDGHGLPPEIQLENSPGFGLNLVNMLIEQISGKIEIERGRGTRFNMEFDTL